MRRSEFKKIIVCRSFWKIDRRRGNYRLPSGAWLSEYVRQLVESQLKLDSLAIAADGSIHFCMPADQPDCIIIQRTFGENEECTAYRQDKRISALVDEIIGR